MIGRALLLAALIGGAVIALQFPILALTFWLIDSSAEVEHYAREYFLIRVWAMPAVLGTYAIIGWLYGLRNVRTPLVLQIVTNGLNIALDLLFVFGFGWGVAGVAFASVIAEYTGLLLGLLYVWINLRGLPQEGGAARILDRAQMLRMLSINTDIVLRTVCVVSVLGFFMAKSAALGDVTLAANQVLHQFLVFTSFALDGFAHAAEAILGEAVGRRDREAFRRGMRVVFLWAGLVGVVNVLIYILLGPAIIALMTGMPEVRAAAGEYLLWPALMPLVSVWAYTYDGVYLAATRTKVMRNAAIASFIVFLVVLHVLLPIVGNAALWAAVGAFLACRGVLLHLLFPQVLRTIT
jgi:multidrug resistance protein, MATE family